VDYIETSEFLLFGVVKVKNDRITLVLGPTSQIKPSKELASGILRELGEPYSRIGDLMRYFQSSPNYQIENFLQILCFVNYALNNEKKTILDLIKQESSLFKPKLQENPERAISTNDEVNLHNTYEAEKIMLSYITAGNTEALSLLFDQPPTGRVGKIAHNELRQRKNTFVCAATLASRAAIAGGLSTEIAFTMSDLYIQKAELLKDSNELTMLSMEMLLDFTRRVEQVRCRDSKSKLATEVIRFINKNINREIGVTDIASALSMNRSYLGEKFKSDTGVSIGAFITEQKIEEAKRLLRTTEQSIVQISEYLCFSSQSYFQNVFKKIVGCTPKNYRGRFQQNQ
jgi:AraC-like DNA-binding protein